MNTKICCTSQTFRCTATDLCILKKSPKKRKANICAKQKIISVLALARLSSLKSMVRRHYYISHVVHFIVYAPFFSLVVGYDAIFAVIVVVFDSKFKMHGAFNVSLNRY